MNISQFKNVVTSKTARQILLAKKHSPNALFGAGVVGVVATAVLASKATLGLEDILEETEKNLIAAKYTRENHADKYTEEDLKKDKVIIYSRAAMRIARLYAPAICVGSLSIAALTGAHVIMNRRNVALTAAYATLEKGFNEYRDRVREEFGDDREYDLRHGIKTEKVKDGNKKIEKRRNPELPSIYARFFDEYSNQWMPNPEYNKTYLINQQNYANDMLRSRGHVFLNEVYDKLGIPRSKEGAVVGWVAGEGDDYIDFGIFDGEREARRSFVNGNEASILLDFNVSGVIYDKI